MMITISSSSIIIMIIITIRMISRTTIWISMIWRMRRTISRNTICPKALDTSVPTVGSTIRNPWSSVDSVRNGSVVHAGTRAVLTS